MFKNSAVNSGSRSGTLDSTVAPVAVLLRKTNDQGFDLSSLSWPPGPAVSAPVVLLGDEPPVPCQQGCGGHKSCHLGQNSPPQALRLGRQPTTLVVSQPQPPIAKLFARDAVLLAQIIDGLQVMLVHPASEGDHQESKRVQQLSHQMDPLSNGRRV
jgi:hypothetical protein